MRRIERDHAGGRERRVEGYTDVLVTDGELLAVTSGFTEMLQGGALCLVFVLMLSGGKLPLFSP